MPSIASGRSPASDRIASVERYARAARAAGCPKDQILNFTRANIVMQPRQILACAAARACDHRCPACEADYAHGREPRIDCPDCGPTRVCYGGARGGGKTHWSISQVFADDCARFAGLKFLYLRKSAASAEEAIGDLRKGVLRYIPHTFKIKDSLLVRDDNGSSIKLRHFQHEKDIESFQGLEYDGLLIEEGTQLTGAKVNDATASMRTSKPGWRPRAYFTTNPGGIGHSYFKKTFIQPFRDGKQGTTRFIPATVRDNRFANPEYRSELNRLTGVRRATWLDGDWDAIAGQFFENWSHDRHVLAPEVCTPAWSYWLGFDYGYNHPTACYLFARDLDGVTWVLDEHWARKTQVADHARAIKNMVARHVPHGVKLETIVAGGDVFNRDRDGKSTADEYARHGLRLDRADNDRVTGAAEITRMLGDDGRDPTLFISPRCHRLIRAIPEMVHDDIDIEKYAKVDIDEDGDGGDDSVDALRYALMYRPGPKGSKSKNPFADV